MDRTYTILLDKSARGDRNRSSRLFTAPLELAAHLMGEPPRPALHRERLSPQELIELSDEPGFVAAAEVMRTRLLVPVPERSDPASIRQSRQSWGIAAVGADQSPFSGAGVLVAVLDTGMAPHATFRGINAQERDFTGLGAIDRDGHGTQIAATIFGRDVGGVRLGVARGVRRALIGKIFGSGGGDSDMLFRALLWGHEEQARVIALSVGFDFSGTARDRVSQGWPEELAAAAALEAYRDNWRLIECLLTMLRLQEPLTGGALVVAAAGNDSRRGAKTATSLSASLPAHLSNLVLVGSFDPNPGGLGYRVSDFSNRDPAVSAPGRSILSAHLDGRVSLASGTSLAAAHAAGIAALWWEALEQSEATTTATLVRRCMLAAAQTKGFAVGFEASERGAGRIVAPQEGVAAWDGRAKVRSTAAQAGALPSVHTSRELTTAQRRTARPYN